MQALLPLSVGLSFFFRETLYRPMPLSAFEMQSNAMQSLLSYLEYVSRGDILFAIGHSRLEFFWSHVGRRRKSRVVM